MEKFCGKCGQPIDRCTCSRGAAVTGGGAFEVSPRMRAVRLSEGETVVWNYLIAEHWLNKLGLQMGVAKLIITNKRSIFVTEKRSLLQYSTVYGETYEETIQGLSASVDRRWSVLGLLLTAYLGVMSIKGIPYLRYLPWWSWLSIPVMLLLLVYLCIQAIKPIIAMELTGGLENNRHMKLALGLNPKGRGGLVLLAAKCSTVFVPTKNAEAMLAEAGAIIRDLRDNGDRAVAKWQRR